MPLSHYRWFTPLLAVAVCSPALGGPKPLRPGQYQIGYTQIQQICLKDDGTWYGTTFNFGGRWTSAASGVATIKAAIFGNYTIQGHDNDIFANDTITVEKLRGGTLTVTWYDWYDDFSFQNLLTGEGILFVKRNCDPRLTGANTHAATE